MSDEDKMSPGEFMKKALDNLPVTRGEFDKYMDDILVATQADTKEVLRGVALELAALLHELSDAAMKNKPTEFFHDPKPGEWEKFSIAIKALEAKYEKTAEVLKAQRKELLASIGIAEKEMKPLEEDGR